MLDFLRREEFYPHVAPQRLISDRHDVAYELQMRDGHLFLSWPTASALYTRAELSKRHRQFFHPTSEKLFGLLRRASLDECTPETRLMLEDITKACKVCTKFRTKLCPSKCRCRKTRSDTIRK